MKKMILKELTVENFQNYALEHFIFDNLTIVSGRNGTGKSSIANAYMWLLFNCDAELNDNPNIRRLVDNIPVRDADVSVSAVFDIDGIEVSARKVQRRKHGKDGVSYSDTNSYFINEVPYKLTDFNEYFSVDKLKICTNTNTFLAQKTADAREFLFNLVENVTDKDVASDSDDLAALVPYLDKYTATELEAMNKSTKANIAKEIPIVDGRIKEKEHDIAEKSGIDISKLADERLDLQSHISQLELESEDYDKKQEQINEFIRGMRKANYELTEQLDKMQSECNAENRAERARLERLLDESAENIRIKKSVVFDTSYQASSFEAAIQISEKEKKQLTAKWKEEKARTMDNNSLNCPYCGQVLPENKQKEIISDFNNKKQSQLDQIASEGQHICDEIRRKEDAAKKLRNDLSAANTQLAEEEKNYRKIKKQLDDIPQDIDVTKITEYQEIKNRIACNEAEIERIKVESVSGSAVEKKAKIKDMQDRLMLIEKQIAKADVSADEQRLNELREQKLDMEQVKADAEYILSMLDDLSKAKNDMLTGLINDRFSVVKWKLYELAKNGNYKNVCIPMVDGKSLLDVTSNKGNVIIGKLDICCALQKISGINCPILLDDAESLDLDNRFRVSGMADSQMIMFIVNDDESVQLSNGFYF